MSPSDQLPNRLRIRAKSLNLDLAGAGEYILRAYDAIHPVLLERFQESIEGVLEDPEPSIDHPNVMDRTFPMHKPVDPRFLETPLGGVAAVNPEPPRHLNVVVCNEVYNKIYLVDRVEINSSIFSRVVDFEAVNRVYVNRSQRDRFRHFFRFGKVLWRELTSAGRAVVKGG